MYGWSGQSRGFGSGLWRLGQSTHMTTLPCLLPTLNSLLDALSNLPYQSSSAGLTFSAQVQEVVREGRHTSVCCSPQLVTDVCDTPGPAHEICGGWRAPLDCALRTAIYQILLISNHHSFHCAYMTVVFKELLAQIGKRCFHKLIRELRNKDLNMFPFH